MTKSPAHAILEKEYYQGKSVMEKKVIVKLKVKNNDMYDVRNMVNEGVKKDSDEYIDDIENEDVSAFPIEGIEIITEGYISRENGRFALRYVETDEDMLNEITTISYDEAERGIITMERNGICRTAMVFEKGKRYVCVYDVSGMVLELVVRTYELDNRLDDNGGNLMLGYTLENGGATVARVKMIIEANIVD